MRLFRYALVYPAVVEPSPASSMNSLRAGPVSRALRDCFSFMSNMLNTRPRRAQLARAENERFPAIVLAAHRGLGEVVRTLAESEGTSRATLEKTLLFAAFNGHADIVNYLLDRDPSLWESTNTGAYTIAELGQDSDDSDHSSLLWTPLKMAVRNGHVDVVSALIHHGARVDSELLCDACRFQHIDVMARLIDGGADVNAPTRFTPFPLTCAVFGGRKDLVELLLRHGATSGISEGLLFSRSAELTQFLLENGADPNIASAADQKTALYVAVQGSRDQNIAKLLVDHGADLRPDAHGVTPLELAITQGKTFLVELFIEAGLVRGIDIPASVVNRDHQRRLLLAGARNTGVADLTLHELMSPILAVQEALGNGMYPAVDGRDLVAYAFEAHKAGANAEFPGWSDSKQRLVSSIISELVNLGCSELNFYYSVAPFLADADEDMLRHTETAFKYLGGSLAGFPETNRATMDVVRRTNGEILNEMIQRSSRFGLRPVVKALFSIYHEEWQVMRVLRRKELPKDVLGLVMSQDNGNLKSKAMQKLMQAIRRLQQ